MYILFYKYVFKKKEKNRYFCQKKKKKENRFPAEMTCVTIYILIIAMYVKHIC